MCDLCVTWYQASGNANVFGTKERGPQLVVFNVYSLLR